MNAYKKLYFILCLLFPLIFAVPSFGDGALPFDPARTAVFQDKLGLFTVALPAGCEVRDQSTATRAKVTLRYGGGCSVIFRSSVMNKSWDARSAMDEKMAALRGARVVGQVRDISSRLRRLDLADGYEYTALKNDTHCMLGFAGVARGRSFVYVVEIFGVKDAAAVGRSLADVINGSFRVTAPPAPADAPPPDATRPAGLPPRYSAAPAVSSPASAGADDDWRGAESAIKITGIVYNQQQVLAMVDGNMIAVGDVLPVSHNGRLYQFRVTAIKPEISRLEVKPLSMP